MKKTNLKKLRAFAQWGREAARQFEEDSDEDSDVLYCERCGAETDEDNAHYCKDEYAYICDYCKEDAMRNECRGCGEYEWCFDEETCK